MSAELIQIISGTLGSFCFGILFNLRGKRLIASTVGGFLSWGAVVLLTLLAPQFGETLIYFLVSVLISLYAEIAARVLRTPATPLITTALIPLIPGGSLYYTFASVFDPSLGAFEERAGHTFMLAAALALGMITVLTFFELLTASKKRKKHDPSKSRS